MSRLSPTSRKRNNAAFANIKQIVKHAGLCHRDYSIPKRDGIAEMLCRFSFVLRG